MKELFPRYIVEQYQEVPICVYVGLALLFCIIVLYNIVIKRIDGGYKIVYRSIVFEYLFFNL